MSRILLAPVAALLLSGCVARAAYDVATLPVTAYHGAKAVVTAPYTAYRVATVPVRVTAKAVDLATTSPSERDRKYLRRMRKEQEKRDKEARRAARRNRDEDGAG